MIVKRTALAFFSLVVALALVQANIVVIQALAQNNPGNMTKAGNMTNATGAKRGSPGASEPPSQIQLCRGATCHIISGCIVCH